MSSLIVLSQSALEQNIRILRAKYPQRKAYACIKSNAYGHGVEEIIRMAENHVDGFCVVSTREARKARSITSRPLFVLNIVDPQDISWCAENGVTLPLASEAQRQMYGEAKVSIKVHLELDTGMIRTGFGWTKVEEMAQFAATLPANILVEGIYSHFVDPDGNPVFTAQQVERFRPFVEAFSEVFGRQPIAHIDKTDSALIHATDRLAKFSDLWMRLGMGIYGASRSNHSHDLTPVLSWKTTILDIHTVKAGQSVGYNRTYFTERDAKIVTLPVGYADGFSRRLSNTGHVLIGGRPCPIRGLVCMNMTMVEVPEDIAVNVGDEVVLLGTQGPETVTAVDYAEWIGTSPYEVVTRLAPHLERRVV